jgi:tellurite resistance protein
MARVTGPVIPASLFGVVVGLAGLAGSWRSAVHIWAAPAAIGEGLMLIAGAVWTVLALLYLLKWIASRKAAMTELLHPVQSGFVALVPLTALLMGLALAPYSHAAALALLVLGGAGQLALGTCISAKMWRGEREPTDATTVLYLPGVGANFVAATLCGTLGYPDWGGLFFGAGAISWLVLESIIYQRHVLRPPLPVPVRPALGIQLAPPVVGAVAYLSISSGPPDVLVHAMWGYGLLQALLLLRLWPWLAEFPSGAGAWAFTFGVTSLATAPMRMMERGDTGAAQWLALPLFLFANVFVLVLAFRTGRLAFSGKLLSPAIGLGKPPESA